MAIEKRIGAYSAYAIAIENGFTGTEKEWLESLIGKTGAQGWSVKSAKISADGKLIFTIENPATGEIKDLPSLDIDELDAIEAIEGAQNTGVQAVKDTETAAVEAVTSAQTAGVQAVQGAQTTAINAISEAQTQATEAVDTAKTQAIQGINAAGQTAVENAQTAITTAKNQAVTDVQAAGQSAVGAVEEAQTTAVEAVGTSQTNAVQAVKDAGTEETGKISSILPVPTEADAWKVPVVKEDGSGYELVKDSYETVEIANITVSESVEKLVIEMNAFDYRKVLVKVYAPGNNQSSQLLLNALVNEGRSVRFLIRVPEGAIDSSPRTTTIIWDVIPPIGINKNTQPLYAGVALTSISAMNLAEIYQTDMTELQISSVLGDAIIPSGTIVTVIGVR